MPNALVRFQQVVGWLRTILFGVVFLAMLAAVVSSIVGGKPLDWPIWFVPGLVLGVLLRPVLMLKPTVTMYALNGMWVVLAVFLVIHKSLGRPIWSSATLAGATGIYIAASFVFYSSTVMYLASLLEKQAATSDSD